MIDVVNTDMLDTTLKLWNAISGFETQEDGSFHLILDFDGNMKKQSEVIQKYQLEATRAIYGGIRIKNWESFLSEVCGQEFCSEILYDLHHNLVDWDLEIAFREAENRRRAA